MAWLLIRPGKIVLQESFYAPSGDTLARLVSEQHEQESEGSEDADKICADEGYSYLMAAIEGLDTTGPNPDYWKQIQPNVWRNYRTKHKLPTRFWEGVYLFRLIDEAEYYYLDLDYD